MYWFVFLGSTQVERRAIRESAMGAGAREYFLLKNQWLRLWDSGMPVERKPVDLWFVDIGGVVLLEVAIISL